MKGKTVEQSDLIGEIKDFPIEVVQAMVDEQVMQGKKADAHPFWIDKSACALDGGFRFDKSVDGFCFWDEVINRKNFNLFFQKYPKTQPLPEQKCISIEVPDGYEIDSEKSTFTNIVFKPIECKYPKSWEDAFIDSPICGYWVNKFSEIRKADWNAVSYDKNVFKTEKQAKSALAYAQITQLMALSCYNGDWTPDWGNHSEKKYCPCAIKGQIIPSFEYNEFNHIAFKDFDICESFLKNHEDLLRQYFEMD